MSNFCLVATVETDPPSALFLGKLKVSETSRPAFLKAVADLITEFDESGPGANGRHVVVFEIDQAEFAKWLPGGNCPRNGLYANPVDDGEIFPSARALSQHLGLKHNEVAMSLAKVSHEPPRERFATLRGVTFIYHEDLYHGKFD